jgi:hypothetical protein
MGLITGLVSTIAHAASGTTHEQQHQQAINNYGYSQPQYPSTNYYNSAYACSHAYQQTCNICAFARPLGSKRQLKRERRAMKHAAKAYCYSGGQYNVLPMAGVSRPVPMGRLCGRERRPDPVAQLVGGVMSLARGSSSSSNHHQQNYNAAQEQGQTQGQTYTQPRRASFDAQSFESRGEHSQPPAYERGEYVEGRRSVEVLTDGKRTY